MIARALPTSSACGWRARRKAMTASRGRSVAPAAKKAAKIDAVSCEKNRDCNFKPNESRTNYL
jgi:hypothetical protein